MNIVIHLVGTNGSGKSTPPKELYDMSSDKIFIRDEKKNGKSIIATFLKDMNILLVGNYKNDCGGGDSLTGDGGLARVNSIVDNLLTIEEYKNIPIIVEGLLLGSYVNIMKLYDIIEIQNEAKYVIIFFDPPLDKCIERVYIRNGGKKINEGSVAGRHGTIHNTTIPRIIEDQLISNYVWDNSEIQKDDMVPELFNIIDRVLNDKLQ